MRRRAHPPRAALGALLVLVGVVASASLASVALTGPRALGVGTPPPLPHAAAMAPSRAPVLSPFVPASAAPTWIDLTTKYSTAPGARSFANMAWDTASGKAVLFGGENGGLTPDGDTWTFSVKGGWTQVCSSCSPSGRAEAQMAYDTHDNVVVMFGGCTGLSNCPIAETWTYSSGVWTKSTAGTTPTQDMAGGMSDDPSDGEVVMYGGCSSFNIDILDPSSSACNSNAFLSTTYTFTTSTGWTQASPTNVPQAREAPGMAYDPLTGTVLMYGGYTGSVGLSDMWAFHAGQWFQLHPATTPGALSNMGMFWDAAASEMIIYGGDNSVGAENQTWAYSGGNWTELFPSTNPGDRDGMTDASPPTGFPVLFGGENAGGTNLGDTWAFGPQLSAAASVAPLATDVGQPVSFSSLLSGGQPPYTTSWTFGDGSPASASANTTHTYTAPSAGYTATFSVTDSYGFSATQSFTVVIAALPTLTAAGSPRVGGPGNVTSFWANATGGTAPLTYAWSFGDGGTSAVADPQHVYAGAGTYTAQVVVADAVGVAVNASVPITVKLPPGAFSVEFTPSKISGLAPLTVTFTENVTGGTAPYTYLWDFGDGSATVSTPNATHTFSSIGTYTVNLTASDHVGHQKYTTLAISALPGPFSASPAESVTSGESPESVNFTAGVSGGIAPYNYSWSFGDGGTSSLADPQHVFTDPGPNASTFSPTLTVSDSDHHQSLYTLPTISLVPAVAVLLQTPAYPPKVGEEANFSAEVTGGQGPFSFSWDYGDGTSVASTGSANTTQHAYLTNASFRVTVTVTDSFGRSASSSGTVSPGASTSAENLSVTGFHEFFNGSGEWVYAVLPMALGGILVGVIYVTREGEGPLIRRPPKGGPKSPPAKAYSEPETYLPIGWR